MNNIEKYAEAFYSSFEVNETQLNSLAYNEVPLWDSVGHMILISKLEDLFNIEIDSEDIMTINSYEKGKQILTSKYGIKFNV